MLSAKMDLSLWWNNSNRGVHLSVVGLTVILANVDCPFGERRTSQGTNVFAKLKVWQIRNIVFLDILSRALGDQRTRYHQKMDGFKVQGQGVPYIMSIGMVRMQLLWWPRSEKHFTATIC